MVGKGKSVKKGTKIPKNESVLKNGRLVKKYRKAKKESFNIYIFKVLKQVHPGNFNLLKSLNPLIT